MLSEIEYNRERYFDSQIFPTLYVD